MTGSRLEPNREVPGAYGAGDAWTRLLVPILTAYQFLENRFGPATRSLASLIFLVSRRPCSPLRRLDDRTHSDAVARIRAASL